MLCQKAGCIRIRGDEGQVWKPGPAYPASGKQTSLSSTDPTPSVSSAEGGDALRSVAGISAPPNA